MISGHIKNRLQVQITDAVVRFESELDSDLDDLKGFFKYHVVDSDLEADYTVMLKRQVSFRLPQDAETKWKSNRPGITPPEKQQRRRRVRMSSKMDTFGVASCYFSPKRGEFYYGLMSDKSWISCCPSKHQIMYILHKRPARNDSEESEETIDTTGAMPLLLHIISTFLGRILVHGAAVCLNDKATLFLGKSGSGKSTLSTDLARKGASFMGDDLVFIYTKAGVPMVGSLLLPAKLYMDDTPEKTSVDVPREMQADYCLSAPLQAVYSVQQNGLPTSTVEPRPAVELLQQLMEASNDMMMQYNKQQWFDTLYLISQQVPYFLFHFGDRISLNTSFLTINR